MRQQQIKMDRGRFSQIAGEAIALVRADKQCNAIKLLQQQVGCGPFKARLAVDVIANRLHVSDPSVVPFRTVKLQRRKKAA